MEVEGWRCRPMKHTRVVEAEDGAAEERMARENQSSMVAAGRGGAPVVLGATLE